MRRAKKKNRQKKISLPPSRGSQSDSPGRGKLSARRGLGRAWRDWLESKGPVVRFVVLFALLMGAFYAVYLPFSGEEGIFGTYLALIAKGSGAILRLVGQDVTVDGTVLDSSRFGISIVRGCDGVEATALFAAAVLASPVALRARILFALAGAAALVAINLLRNVTLFLVGVYYPKAFDRIHFEAWPGVLIVLVLASWLIWAQWAVRASDQETDTTP